MADCLHQIDLCPDCDGLRSVWLQRLPGVSCLTLNADSPAISYQGPAAVYIGPTPGPCRPPMR
ncbi:hypothetical protein ACWC9U_22215 [Streptomyces sp. 900116325]